MNTNTKRILVVDDDPIIGKSFQRVLTTRGYAVITAANGQEALDKIAAEQYDAVFTDIKMPGMDGIEVARNIKKTQPWLPVVIISGYATNANEQRAHDVGVDTVLHKPLSPEMIEREVDRAMIKPEVEILPPVAAQLEVPVFYGYKARAKNIALFLVAPIVGLAYVIALPFVGLGVLAWLGIKAVRS